jgi:hypothetical protein
MIAAPRPGGSSSRLFGNQRHAPNPIPARDRYDGPLWTDTAHH